MDQTVVRFSWQIKKVSANDKYKRLGSYILGIFGSIGMTGLYLFYVQLGRHLLPLIKNGIAIRRTLTLMVIFWVALCVVHIMGFQVSRRLSNMGYVIWICAMAMSFLSFCIIGDNFRSRNGIQLPKLITAMNLTQLPGNKHIMTSLL